MDPKLGRIRGTMEDERPEIGTCEVCHQPIYGETALYYADDYYDFDGSLVCDDCLREFCQRFKKGG